MKTFFTILVAFSLAGIVNAQKNVVPADIILKDGKTIHAYHFGQLDCSGSRYFNNHILIKGMYEGIVSEIKDYSKISKIELMDFSAAPVATGDNEKGLITVFKKNGVTYSLSEASFNLGCYDVNTKKNQLIVQVLNPVTEKPAEVTVNTAEIQYIIFK